jgi:hypothetical protein
VVGGVQYDVSGPRLLTSGATWWSELTKLEITCGNSLGNSLAVEVERLVEKKNVVTLGTPSTSYKVVII